MPKLLCKQGPSTKMYFRGKEDQNCKRKVASQQRSLQIPLIVPQRKAAQSDLCRHVASQHDGCQQHIQKIGPTAYFWTSGLLSELHKFNDKDKYNTNTNST